MEIDKIMQDLEKKNIQANPSIYKLSKRCLYP